MSSKSEFGLSHFETSGPDVYRGDNHYKEEQQMVEGKLISIAKLNALAPQGEWTGSISAQGEQALTEDQGERFKTLIIGATSPIEAGGQAGCIDGRGGASVQLGPKTAGGTIGDAYRVLHALYAYDPENGWRFEQALQFMYDYLSQHELSPGGHELEQCGAYRFGRYALTAVSEKADIVSSGVRTFMGAMGGTFDESLQHRLVDASKFLSTDTLNYLPDSPTSTDLITSENPAACPNLLDDHKEKLLVVYSDGQTLDNNKLIAAAVENLGFEAQAFAYNWGHHVNVAAALDEEFPVRDGVTVGKLYLQAVPSHDIPVLTQLTDGSLEIVAFQKAA